MRVTSHYSIIIMLMLFCVRSTAQRASADALSRLRGKVDPYVTLTDSNTEWLTSRLHMYWHSHATDVYIDGDTFHHAGGKRAPVPTV